MTSAQVVETSVNVISNSPSQDYYTHLDDRTLLYHTTPGFKPFKILRSLGRQSERLANIYISYASNIRRIRQQLWFNHHCKDLGLVPSGLRLKSPLNTQEAIQIVKATCRRLIWAQINDCHRRLNHYSNNLTNSNNLHVYGLTYSTLYVTSLTNELRKQLNNTTLKGLGHAILGNFSTDQMVIELTKISK